MTDEASSATNADGSNGESRGDELAGPDETRLSEALAQIFSSGSSDPKTIARELVSLSVESRSYRGPLPRPEDLAEYEKTVPGAAERIIAMAERQAEHRQALERVVVEGGARNAHQGLWLGFIISLVVLGLGTTLVLTGHEVVGATVMALDVVSLAGVFVFGRIDQRRERVQKAKSPPGSVTLANVNL